MKLPNFISKSISSKLIALFLILSIVPVVLIGVIIYTSSKTALMNTIEANIISVVNSRASHIANFVTVSLDVVNSASALSLFRDNVYNLKTGKDVIQSRAILEKAMEDWEAKSNVFYRAKILDLNGVVIATTKNVLNDMGTNRVGYDYFKMGLKGPFVSDPYISPDDHVAVITYSTPIYAPNSKSEVIGVLVIHQATEALKNKDDLYGNGLGINGITLNNEGMGETGETYLVNKEGLLISPTRFDQSAFLKQKVEPTMLEKELSAIQVDFKNFRGILSVGKAQKIAGTEWSLVCKFDSREAYAPVRKLGNIMLLMIALIFIVVYIIAYFVSRYFTSPIIYLTNVAGEMTRGKLDQQISVELEDEIGNLAVSFQTMQKTMLEKAKIAKNISEGNLIIDVQPLSDQDIMGLSFQTMIAKLRVQLKNISEGVNVLGSSSSEIMAAVTQLASTSAEIATSVGETTITVEEVKQTAVVSNNKAKAVTENSIKAADISKDGMKAIGNTIEGMNKIRVQMNAIAGMVVKLSEQSQIIGDITATVNGLAEQSNLLAVNAAIEAAKAGEQGKGFSVVAQEIKLLANRSKEATSQVRGILRDVQKSISSVVMATEEGGKTVEEGLKLTYLSGESIKMLSDSVVDAANAAIQIAASSQQQLEGMDQVVVAMENIREASMQAATSTQQSVESITELQKVGENLDALMKQYKLK
jgi:methyl-accepting chemotaxis protein